MKTEPLGKPSGKVLLLSPCRGDVTQEVVELGGHRGQDSRGSLTFNLQICVSVVCVFLSSLAGEFFSLFSLMLHDTSSGI